MQGKTHGIRIIIIIKTYDSSDEAAVEAFTAELRNYRELQALQGLNIPRLLCWGTLQDSFNPTLALQHCCVNLEKPTITRQHYRLALNRLRALHKAGFVHGNICWGSLVWDPVEQRMVLVDLVKAKRTSDSTCFMNEETELGNWLDTE